VNTELKKYGKSVGVFIPDSLLDILNIAKKRYGFQSISGFIRFCIILFLKNEGFLPKEIESHTLLNLEKRKRGKGDGDSRVEK